MVVSGLLRYKRIGGSSWQRGFVMGSSRTFNRFWALLAIGVSSSAFMMWSIWHYPVGTGIAAALVLAALGISAALTRAVDVDVHSEAQVRGHGA